MSPYPGFKGKYFSMPVRNVVPKPLQKPHPPIWVACSRRETIHAAARAGIGALTFAFVDPAEAGKWASEYYEIIKSAECVPIGHTVNANVAMVTGFSCHENREEARRRGAEGFQFFGYSLGHYYVYGHHQPGVTDVWERFEAAKDKLPAVGQGSGIGTPAELTEHLRQYQDAGVDQVVFIQQGGRNKHEHICDSLKLFAAKVMPTLKTDQAARDAKKQAELAPFIAAALKRKKRMAPVAPGAGPTVSAYGRTIVQENQNSEGPTHHIAADITVMMDDPAEKKNKAAAE
jgi:alkanesulfonate monooxygenase SsuD/methylene tetrahydromethanopterin reductase-like flavin-dependent oxidoreductase (luciferase family)